MTANTTKLTTDALTPEEFLRRAESIIKFEWNGGVQDTPVVRKASLSSLKIQANPSVQLSEAPGASESHRPSNDESDTAKAQVIPLTTLKLVKPDSQEND